MEGLPNGLGPEWRVLHPLEIPGVRFPTDDTPPNHRTLAESDALVELIQMAEYLEDAPSWGQRRFYPPWYGNPFYRGWGRGPGRGKGRGRNWLSEDTTERDSGEGQGRISHGNGRGREMFQRTFENDRQDGNWSIPTHVEGRNDTRQESWVPLPPLPSRFSDWSSLGSPHARASPHSISNREVEQNVNIPNQLNVQSGTAPREETIRANSQEEVIVPPQISQQSEEQNIQMIEMEPNPLNIEVRTQRDGTGTDKESNVPIIQPSGNVIPPTDLGESMPILNVSTGSENNFETLRDSHLRSQGHSLQEIPVITPVDRLI